MQTQPAIKKGDVRFNTAIQLGCYGHRFTANSAAIHRRAKRLQMLVNLLYCGAACNLALD